MRGTGVFSSVSSFRLRHFMAVSAAIERTKTKCLKMDGHSHVGLHLPPAIAYQVVSTLNSSRAFLNRVRCKQAAVSGGLTWMRYLCFDDYNY